MTAAAQENGTVKSARARRHDTGTIRISQRDIDGLLLCGEHYGAPLDLLAEALGVSHLRANAIAHRWRRGGYVDVGQLGSGPPWTWLTRDGMRATGLGYPATPPTLGRLAHYRAILAARLWLTTGPAWAEGQAWWHSERRLRDEHPTRRGGHNPDAEIHWPSIDDSPYAGQIWAIEVELSAKQIERTTEIITGMLASMKYATVVYLTAPAARSAVRHAVSSLPAEDQAKVAVRDLPANAFGPKGRR
jgi:hypothetical protein